ncbi:hypothetical protein [Pseudoxanthomonas dokdonensis]|uniref:Uncharacterized protein n=1 Tax=Pseudoxanthomonas dokdonensis TaxID=344882 RepID=A0A0R0CIS9_9GAMM|nr:hypothetical protein [Pseudoxanthomonas dokdonensis]KRG69142.1 hypothetical protein ABB29_12115 [Pseudoxanthomonas dokdonensis]
MSQKRTYLCPDCDGYGETVHNDTNPYGYGPDPQCDVEVECRNCDGSGVIVSEYDDTLQPWNGTSGRMGSRPASRPDPLITMARWRGKLRGHPTSPSANLYYGYARQIAVSPVALPDMRPVAMGRAA